MPKTPKIDHDFRKQALVVLCLECRKECDIWTWCNEVPPEPDGTQRPWNLSRPRLHKLILEANRWIDNTYGKNLTSRRVRARVLGRLENAYSEMIDAGDDKAASAIALRISQIQIRVTPEQRIKIGDLPHSDSKACRELLDRAQLPLLEKILKTALRDDSTVATTRAQELLLRAGCTLTPKVSDQDLGKIELSFGKAGLEDDGADGDEDLDAVEAEIPMELPAVVRKATAVTPAKVLPLTPQPQPA
jgi:hypothetical protein